jgi:hypothetical protein
MQLVAETCFSKYIFSWLDKFSSIKYNTLPRIWFTVSNPHLIYCWNELNIDILVKDY